MKMDIKKVMLIDQYLMSNITVQTLDVGEMELLRKFLYNVISKGLDCKTLNQILAYSSKVFKGKTSFTQDLKKFSTRAFDLILAKQRQEKIYQSLT